MNKKIVALVKVVVVLGIVFLVLYRRIDVRGLYTVIRGIPLSSLAAFWFTFGIIFILNAFRWQFLVRVQCIGASFLRLLEFVFIGLFFNNIMLGSMGGDVFKAYYLAREAPSRKEAAVTTVLADRIVAFFSFFLIGLAGIAFNGAIRPLRAAVYVFLAFYLAISAVLVLALQKDLLGRIPFAKKLGERLPFQKNIRTLYDAFYAYRFHHGQLAKALAVALVVQVTFIAVLYCLARAIGIDQVTFGNFLLLVPLCTTVFALPILPGGWGAGEIAFIGFFGLLGVSADRALALDLVMRAMVISWSLVGGFLYAMPRWRVPAETVRENSAESLGPS